MLLGRRLSENMKSERDSKILYFRFMVLKQVAVFIILLNDIDLTGIAQSCQIQGNLTTGIL